MMNLKSLLMGINAKVYGKVLPLDVRNLTRDSRCVGVGDIFIAHKGARYDGNDFSVAAIKNGAIAVLSSLYNPFLPVVQVVASDLDQLEAEISAKYYGNPSNKLRVIGVTGTNGKTTVSYLVKHLLDGIGSSTGLLGTVEHILGPNKIQDNYTTPTASLLQKYLAEIVRHQQPSVVMEVSSIGIELKRIACIDFEVGILTNVTQDHLDFHQSMENYLAAKLRLFRDLPKTGLSIINRDSAYSEQFLAVGPSRKITYGIECVADYRATNLVLSRYASSYDIVYQGQVFPVRSPLIGKHNVYNVLAAIATAHQTLSCSIEDLVELISTVQPPRGRLDPVVKGKCPVYIDYAHTPDALHNVCQTLHALLPAGGRLLIVFGCGGDRDPGKRPLMAKVAEAFGFSIVTMDNPRTEDPSAIIEDICAGFTSDNFLAVEDRRQAIEVAIEMATEKDIVLVAGKGHETYQLFKHKTIHFDDKEVVCEVLAAHV